MVSHGNFCLSPKITSVVMNDYLRLLGGGDVEPTPHEHEPLTHLTPRQREDFAVGGRGTFD